MYPSDPGPSFALGLHGALTFTRRRLICGLIATFGVAPPGALGSFDGRGEQFGEAGLSGEEVDDLLAFAEIAVSGRSLSASERRSLIEHIERREPEGGRYYVDLYRMTVQLLTRLTGSPFARLGFNERLALVTRHRLMIPRVGPREQLGAFAEQKREIRTRTIPDLIGAYYASPAGWAVVGYTVFPGMCGDLARYQKPESSAL